MKMSLLAPSPWQRRISLGFGLICALVLLATLGVVLARADDIRQIFVSKGEAYITSTILALLATLLTYRRPGNVIGWLLALATLLRLASPIGLAVELLYPPGISQTLGTVLISNLFPLWSGLTYSLIAYIFVLFPDGKLPSSRWRLVALLLAIQLLLALGQIVVLGVELAREFAMAAAAGQTVELIPLADAGPYTEILHVRRPPWVNRVFVVSALIALAVIMSGLLSQIVRFRTGNYVQRQQIKWVIFAMAIWASLIPFLIFPIGIPMSILILGFVPVPVSVVLAIFRYRLYEIDIIINRTLVYGLLSAALLAVYFGSVVVFEVLTRALTGERSALATVLATLLIAAIFQPLRRRLQAVIDRAFFRRKYDAQQTLEAFAGFVRDEVSMNRLTNALMATVVETFQPSNLLLMIDAPFDQGSDFQD